MTGSYNNFAHVAALLSGTAFILDTVATDSKLQKNVDVAQGEYQFCK